MFRLKLPHSIIIVLLLLLSLAGSSTLASSPHRSIASPPGDAAVSGAGGIRINEVMFYPDTSHYEWVELKNGGSASVNISGYSITDEDGNRYRIPDDLPDVPGGAFVVVIFDGLGSSHDDYDFSDNVATLHTPAGLVDIFEDDADQCALYSVSHFTYLPPILNDYSGPAPPAPTTSSSVFVPPVVAFVAWGGPSEGDDDTAVAAGLWLDEAYLGSRKMPGNEGMSSGGSLGLYPGLLTGSPSDWVIYPPAQTSQGLENPSPTPFFHNPPNDITTDDHQIPFGWSNVVGAVGYHLEVDDDPAFGSPELAVNTEDPAYTPTAPFPDGTFYFRVKALYPGGESAYSATGQVTFITISQVGAMSRTLLDITPKLQHKDTRMLCLDGHPETGSNRWDSAHEDDGDWTVGNGTPVRSCSHDDHYCTRAAISTIVAYYGGNLSQDRISYYEYGGGAPEHDLGCGIGLWPNERSTHGTGKNVFDWAMNGHAVTSSRGKPTFDQVKGWINAGRPLLIVENDDSHSVVLDGYKEIASWHLAHRMDPWTASGAWVLWETWDVTEYHVPPAGVTPRSDEDMDNDGIADTIDDSDGDGICDFDETNRFKGFQRNLDPNNPDTDGDLVPDKKDMRGYLFDKAGNYRRRSPDIDGDGDRKELDPDNDNFYNVGSIDGCEDTNHNGKYEPGQEETSNFDPNDEKECPHPFVNIDSPASGSSDEDCVITLEGTIDSETSLTSASVLITSGSQSNRFDLAWSGSAPIYSFRQEIPLFSGVNLIMVTAVNEFGSGSSSIYVQCTAGTKDIHLQLYWPLLGADVDLHFIRPGGEYWAIPDDCYFSNMNPDWGVPGDPTDDPKLDLDCINYCTLENIVLNRPVTGTYTVKVHYYSDHDLGPTTARVRVWVQGVRHDFSAYLIDDQTWDVCTIEWPSKVVTPGGLAASRRGNEARPSRGDK